MHRPTMASAIASECGAGVGNLTMVLDMGSLPYRFWPLRGFECDITIAVWWSIIIRLSFANT